MHETNLHSSWIASLPEAARRELLASLTDEEALALYHDWPFWARPSERRADGTYTGQLPPPEPWRFWVVMAGRGFGKTRVGAEQVRQWVKGFPLVNLIGATADDARDIMIEGESGILAICHPDERPTYRASKRRLEWPNGARSLIFTADEPERLRGKQHMKLWADELGSWRYGDSWDQAMFGLRLGANPQAVVTMTPKPTQAVRDLLKHPSAVLTTGTTYENRANLAPAFYKEIITKYEGTRLGEQELHARLLEDVPGALWNRALLDILRVSAAPPLSHLVVAVDPAGSASEEASDTGIVVAGMSEDRQGYILADLTLKASPAQWGRRAVEANRGWQADGIIAEVNHGGDMVEYTIQTVAQSLGLVVPVKQIRASRGKRTRAEPISALYEQGRVHHVGAFADLEDQMCTWLPGDTDSPDRMDALVWALTELMIGEQASELTTSPAQTSAHARYADPYDDDGGSRWRKY